ncbi:tripartite tricarboxylate transporter TctB family protein [Piscinibacter sakaiensis]|uniref:tripartite tricarboxylate transporter TctB family protein n=1 Tax=Piscinibacter sakaiensis TaxID=1547922 RepID=UPI003AB102FF
MKIKNQRDFWAGLLFAVAGVVFAIGASGHVLGSSDQPGPGFFPLLLGLLLALLGCLLIFKALTFETDDGAPVGSIGWRALIVVCGSLAVGGLLLPQLGMLLTVALLVWLLGHATQRLALRRWLLLSATSALLVWIVFVGLAGLPIPLWPAVSA